MSAKRRQRMSERMGRVMDMHVRENVNVRRITSYDKSESTVIDSTVQYSTVH